MNNKIKNIINYTIKNGGCTFDKNLEIMENLKGYTVSIAKYEYKTDIKNINAIKKDIQKKIEIIKNKTKTFYIGTWINKNILYIDINKIELNKTRATELAKNQNQIAIFDNINKKEIIIQKNYTYILYEYIEKINDLKYIYEFENKNDLKKYFNIRDLEYIKKFVYNNFDNNIKEYFTKNNKKYILIKEY
jgi:hypothetical protein